MSGLSQNLHKLAVAANDIARLAAKENRLRKLQRVETHTRFLSLAPSASHATESDVRILETPHPADLHALVELCVEQHSDLISELRLVAAGNETPEQLVYTFIHAYLVRCIVDGDEHWREPEQLTAYVVTYLADLNQSPVEMRALLWLEGVSVSATPLTIDKYVLRQPAPEDMNGRVVKHSITKILEPYSTEMLSEFALPLVPSAILETTQNAVAPEEVLQRLRKVALLLSLVGPSYAHTTREECWPNRIRRMAYSAEPTRGFESRVFSTFVATPSICERVEKLVKLGFERTPDRPGKLPQDEALWPLWIAFGKLHDSERAYLPTQASVASGISGLESLLLKRAERSELAGRLSQRTAILMAAFGDTPGRVSSTVGQAYLARSEFVHGSPASNPVGVGLRADVGRYLRAALLVSLQWTKTKDELAKKLDNAALEPAAREKLFSELQALPVLPGPLQSGEA